MASWTPTIADDALTSSSFILREPSISSDGESTTSSTNFQLQNNNGAVAPGASVGGTSGNTLGAGGITADPTPPANGTVNDGSGADIDSQQSMTTIQANWSGFSDPESGISRYEYLLRRTVDQYCWDATGGSWAACSVWNDASTATSISVSGAGLGLRTSTEYITCIRAFNNAGITVETPACSNGVRILPSLTFTYGSDTVSIGSLTSGNSWDSLATSAVSVTTNAYGGYVLYASKLTALRLQIDTSNSIADISDSGCNGSAVSWPSSGAAFGISSTDDIDGNKFNNGGTKYCAIPTTSVGPNGVAVISGGFSTTGGTVTENNTLTFRAKAGTNQKAGSYAVTVLYVLVPTY